MCDFCFLSVGGRGERGLGSRESSKLSLLDPPLSLQPLLCMTIFDVRSKGTGNRRFTKVYKETFLCLEIPNSYFL